MSLKHTAISNKQLVINVYILRDLVGSEAILRPPPSSLKGTHIHVQTSTHDRFHLPVISANYTNEHLVLF